MMIKSVLLLLTIIGFAVEGEAKSWKQLALRERLPLDEDKQATGGTLWEFIDKRNVRNYGFVVFTDGTCFEDSNERILNGPARSDKKNTPKRCKSWCMFQGYMYSGVEAYDWCHCGNGYHGKWQTRIVDQDDCNKNCPGDDKKKCGAGWRINIYKLGIEFTSREKFDD